MLPGHNFALHSRRNVRLLLPQDLVVPIAASAFNVVLQVFHERARQDSNLRPAD
jgi:hypothetical protein